jgi:hypothetical protein
MADLHDGRPNALAQAALAASVRWPVRFAFLDIVGDPIRITTAPYSISFPAGGTGDEDLDGFTFSAIDSRPVSISTIKRKEGGADSFSATLSGLAGIDDDLMTEIGDKSKWQGRDIRIWRAMIDPDNFGRIGNIWAEHTGYMSVPKIVGDATSQTIVLDCESYLGFFTQASNKTYLDQRLYDPDDNSPETSIAIANGTNTQTASAVPFTGWHNLEAFVKANRG